MWNNGLINNITNIECNIFLNVAFKEPNRKTINTDKLNEKMTRKILCWIFLNKVIIHTVKTF